MESLNLFQQFIQKETHKNILKADNEILCILITLSFKDYFYNKKTSFPDNQNVLTKNLIRTFVERMLALRSMPSN